MFSDYRMCSLTIECVLLQEDVWDSLKQACILESALSSGFVWCTCSVADVSEFLAGSGGRRGLGGRVDETPQV